MRRAKSLRIGVHHANAVVWGLVYRTHISFGGVGVRRAPRRRVVDRRRRLFREHRGAVPVRFEVHAHVEALRDRVQVLDPGRRAPGLESERLLRVVPYKNSSPVS